MLKILLVEDETLFAKSVARRLERDNYDVEITSCIADAKASLNTVLPDVLLLDVRLPDGSGLNLLEDIRISDEKAWKDLPIIIMTAYGELEDAISAMKLGATDYLKKPVDLDELVLLLSKVLANKQISQQLDYSHRRDRQVTDKTTMVGASSAITALRQQIKRIALLVDNSTESHPVVLISGETGTGKDVAARLYHQSGSWNNKPFVHVDCASLPSELIEAELFGYERGAFTNAHQAKAGLIEVAEGGTLFLDEVGELPLPLQAKLLNVLERRVVRRLGSTKEIAISAHFVAATNRNLTDMVADGTFRSDLFFRLNILELVLPSLRQRQDDILLLVDHFVEKIARRYGLVSPILSSDSITAIQQYSWPGNIRELQHVLERAVMLCQQGIINSSDLFLQAVPRVESTASSNEENQKLETMKLEDVEKYLIERALLRTNGNVSQSARELGLTRMAMRYRMDKYQL
ncbi:MAG: response regulator [Methylophaga sp.]|nr:response regulator [Methylophaga sp.]